MTNLDATLYRAMNRLANRSDWAHRPVVAYAKLGIGVFAVLLVLGWWQARDTGDLRQMALVVWAGGGALVALGLNQLVGQVIDRTRPYAAMPAAHVLISRTQDFSFPSDHAVAAGAVASGLLLARRTLGWGAVAAALAMGIARVYVGAHYPGDVLAGLGLGAAVVVVGRPVAVRPLEALLRELARSPLGRLVTAEPLRPANG